MTKPPKKIYLVDRVYRGRENCLFLHKKEARSYAKHYKGSRLYRFRWSKADDAYGMQEEMKL